MEKELTLRRNRSLQAVIADGYQLFGKNFWRLFRSSWIHALAYALVLGFSMSTFFTHLLPLLAAHRTLSPHLLVWIATVVAFLVVAWLFAFSGGVAPLQQHSLTDAITGPRRWWGHWPWRLSLRGLVRMPAMLWRTLRSRYAAMLFVVVLVMLLVVLVATLLLQLPAVILATANVTAASDVAAGDVPDMPSHLFLFNFATFSVCGFLQAYIHLTTLFPLYYVWGNVLSRKNTSKTQ